MTGATDQCPKCFEKLGIPDKGVVDSDNTRSCHSDTGCRSNPSCISSHANRLSCQMHAGTDRE